MQEEVAVKRKRKQLKTEENDSRHRRSRTLEGAREAKLEKDAEEKLITRGALHIQIASHCFQWSGTKEEEGEEEEGRPSNDRRGDEEEDESEQGEEARKIRTEEWELNNHGPIMKSYSSQRNQITLLWVCWNRSYARREDEDNETIQAASDEQTWPCSWGREERDWRTRNHLKRKRRGRERNRQIVRGEEKGKPREKRKKEWQRERRRGKKEREKACMPSQTREGRETEIQQWQADELY